jgi:DNA-binding transcriptional ArsR family regulator
MSETTTRTLEVLREPERVAALLPAERRELLEALRERPDSAAGLARRLGESRQRLNYHLRALEEAGLLEVAEERRRGNFTERVLRPTAARFVVDPATLEAETGALPGGDRFSAAYLVGLAARTIREVAELRDRAGAQGKRLATAGLDVEVRLESPEDFRDFVDDLGRAVAGVVAEHHRGDPGGRPFRVTAGIHPSPGPGGGSRGHGGES